LFRGRRTEGKRPRDVSGAICDIFKNSFSHHKIELGL